MNNYKQQFNELLFNFYPMLSDYTDSRGTKISSSLLPLSSGNLINKTEKESSEIPLEILKAESKLHVRMKRKGWGE
jgi:hypothetical protein